MNEYRVAFDVMPADLLSIETLYEYAGLEREESARMVFLAGVRAIEDKTLAKVLEDRYDLARLELERQEEFNLIGGPYATPDGFDLMAFRPKPSLFELAAAKAQAT